MLVLFRACHFAAFVCVFLRVCINVTVCVCVGGGGVSECVFEYMSRYAIVRMNLHWCIYVCSCVCV